MRRLTADQSCWVRRQWLAAARHPRFNRLYTELVYQPMREVMDYLRANGFKTYIVTGGGQDFVRAYARKIYGVPPEQVIGSSIATKYELRDGRAELIRLPKRFFDDDHAGKAIGIDLFIGKRPYAAFGNSTGGREMLEWTGAGNGPRLKCWCITTLHSENMPTGRRVDYRIPGSAPSTRRRPRGGR